MICAAFYAKAKNVQTSTARVHSTYLVAAISRKRRRGLDPLFTPKEGRGTECLDRSPPVHVDFINIDICIYKKNHWLGSHIFISKGHIYQVSRKDRL